ncbi:major facilitator superfamily domain-containing protein [Xylariales sp. PMI_506]|nr:major facilitator superfamily domain-containing protein [Xylariales sp. PMI_506]
MNDHQDPDIHGDGDTVDGNENDRSHLLGEQLPVLGAEPRSSRLLFTFVSFGDLSYMAANFSRKIADSLNQVGNASWLVTGYLITESAFQPMYAQIGLYYGHKVSLVIAALTTTAGLFLCSLSQNLWQLAVSRSIVGLGNAGLELLVLVIINDLVDLYSLPLWKSIITVVSTLSSFLGPSAGAALTDRAGFRLVFGLEFVLMLVATIGIFFTLRLPRSSDSVTIAASRQPMDYVGAGLLLLAVAAPLFTIDLGGQILPWSHPIMILLCILTPVLVVLFFRSQIGRSRPALVPLRFLRNKSVVAVFACGLPAWLAWDQLKYGLGQYVQARSMYSPSNSAFSDWALSCVFVGIPLGSFLSGIIIRRYHALRLLLQAISIINFLTYYCFAAGWIHPEDPAFAPVLLLVGINVGVLDNCWTVSIFSQASPKDQPALYAFFDLGRANTGNFGIAVALASTNAMIRSNLQSALASYPDKDEIIRKSLESFKEISQFPPAIQRIVLDAFVSSSEKAFTISGSILIISVIATFYISEPEETSIDDRLD